MGQRSRKRGRRSRPSAARPRSAPEHSAPGRAAPAAKAPIRGQPAADAPGRGEQRNAAVRATLTPLAPGERPIPLVLSAVIAAVLVAINLVLLVANIRPKVSGQHTSAASEIVYVLVMTACAYGLWRARYWAVLGFMVILLITVLIACLALIRASSLLGVFVPLVVVAGGGYLFYKLIRTLSRVQMPRPPNR